MTRERRGNVIAIFREKLFHSLRVNCGDMKMSMVLTSTHPAVLGCTHNGVRDVRWENHFVLVEQRQTGRRNKTALFECHDRRERACCRLRCKEWADDWNCRHGCVRVPGSSAGIGHFCSVK